MNISGFDSEAAIWALALEERRSECLYGDLAIIVGRNQELCRRLHRFMVRAEGAARAALYFQEQIGHAALGNLSKEAVVDLTRPDGAYMVPPQDFFESFLKDMYEYEWSVLVHGKDDGMFLPTGGKP